MNYTFTARGHKNILAAHKNTLEFTKDKDVSLAGDCIIGVGADFILGPLKKLVKKHRQFVMTISVGKHVEHINFIANKEFNSSREIVLRLSEFISERTLGVCASKAARNISDAMRKKLSDSESKICVDISPVVKAIIFDFDDTINDLHGAILHAHKVLAKELFKKHGIFPATTEMLLAEIDHNYSVKGRHASPSNFDRHRWFQLLFKRVGVKADKKEIDDLVSIYWKAIFSKERPMPHAATVLKNLHSRYKIAVMTDSDGDKAIKMKRARASGLLPYIDIFISSDDVGMNKPNKKFYSLVLDKLSVKASECVMVGDKPQADLILAKPLGMKTVWMKHGHWAKVNKGAYLDYVDHAITDLKELTVLMENM